MSSVAEEIELLERVLFRLGTADTDDKLENAVLKFLTPVLLKIMSPHESVRCKVMEVLTHVNKRLKTRPKVQLPVEALLEQYKSFECTFLHNFSIIYVTMGFPRLPTEKQTDITPKLLNCLEGKSENHQDKLLMLVLPLLESIVIPKDPEKKRVLLGLSDKPLTRKQFLLLLQDVLLLPYGVTADGEIPSGMSSYSFKRVIANNWKAEELEQLKKGICRFICADVFPVNEILILLVLASADTRFSVTTPAIAELSKINTSLDWSDRNILTPFYKLFLGNCSKIVDRKTLPCSARVRQKLLQYLLKGKGKSINTISGLQVVFEGLFGENTNTKCKILTLQFTENLIKEAPIEFIKSISQILLNGINKLLGKASEEPLDVQNGAYCVIAQLARRNPNAVNKDLELVISFFNHFAESQTSLHDSIREALIAIAPSFAWNVINNPSTQNLLLAMLAEYAESKLTILQNTTSVFLTTCFQEHYVPARYLLLIIAGEKSSLYESVTSYLYGVSRKDHINYNQISSVDHLSNDNKTNRQVEATDIVPNNNLIQEQRKIVLPSFKEMVNYIYKMSAKRARNPALKYTYGKMSLPYSYDTYVEILDYLRNCLWFSAGCQSTPGDSKYMNKLEQFIIQNYSENVEMTEITTNFSAVDNTEETEKAEDVKEINIYLEFLKRILLSNKRGNTELLCLYDLLSASPILLSKHCYDLMARLQFATKDVSENTRIIVAKLLGILIGVGTSDDEFNSQIREMYNLTNKSLEHQHGCILSLSYAFYSKIKTMKKMNTLNTEYFQNWNEFKETIKILAGLLTKSQVLLLSSAIKGISLIGSVTELQTYDDLEQSKIHDEPFVYDSTQKMEINDEPSSITKTSIANTIYRMLKSAHTMPKIREETAVCLGNLAIGDAKCFAVSNLKAFTGMVKLTKDVALNIAMAQSIVCTILGQEEIDFDDTKINPYCNDENLNDFINSIIKSVTDPNPCSRHSTAIWLLAIVKNCAKRSPIYTKKQLLQYAFTDLLSDDSEFVQDVASRGLGLVYSLSDSQSQTDLANSLLNQLIGGRREVKQVTDDTQLFEEGVLGKTPMGGNITTYKELCSLASDLNQPDMIYQFLQLANHNAVWNSKLGAAFGLKSISKNAKEQMQPYLGKIVPRLYRYKYDPTPKIQNSMISIWDSIVTNSKDTVERYYWEIYEELCSNLTHTEWRVRIACCLAIRDLIKRPTGLRLKYMDKLIATTSAATNTNNNNADNKMDVINDNENLTTAAPIKMETNETDLPEPELAKLWSQLFRVMDDVHEGTRLAADGTARALSKVCILSSAENYGKSGEIVASSILPLILETGVTNTVAEIRKLSMQTLSELIDSSGSLLTAHLPTLIPCLLKATGELEIPKLSYLSTRLGAQIEAQEAVDSVRAEAATQHLSMETLSKCIRHITYESLETMTPAIIELMRTTVNLGTKIGCAHFLCLISVRFNNEMQPLVGKYLGACFSGLKDRNNIVRKYHASAIGHLIGVAKEQSIINLFNKLTELYFENQSNKGIPQTISSINKRHQEILKDYSQYVLPLIFFAMHEENTVDNERTIELWKELWLEISPGDAGIRMNLESIMLLLEKSLGDQSWLIKTQSANAISTVGNKLGKNLSFDDRNKLITGLLTYLSGRTFHGKERLLEALSSLCDLSLKTQNDLMIHNQIIDAVMKECRKEEPIYRIHALKAIGNILEKLEVDRFEEIYKMIWYIMESKDLADVNPATFAIDDTEILTLEDKNKRAIIIMRLKEVVCDTLGKAWPINSVSTQEKYQLLFVEHCVQCLQNNTRPVQLSLLISLNKFLARLKLLECEQKIDKNGNEMNKDGVVKIDVDVVGGSHDAGAAATTDDNDEIHFGNKEKKSKINPNINLENICKNVLSAVVYVAGIPHTGLKKEALNIVLTLVRKLILKQNCEIELQLVKKTYEDVLERLQKDSAPEIKCLLRDIDEKLKSI